MQFHAGLVGQASIIFIIILSFKSVESFRSFCRPQIAQHSTWRRNNGCIGDRLFIEQRQLVAAALGISLAIVDPLSIYKSVENEHCQLTPAAHADSTGKLSTKLTARRRYLPRVVDGAKTLNSLAANPSHKSAVDAFVTEELPGLKRAMNLYGDSLRRGEVPDKISRRAEELTTTFYENAVKLNKVDASSLPNQLKLANEAMKDYLEFAGVAL